VLAVDELSLGLAPKVVRELVGHLREFHEASGMGLLLVEQNARLALEICERAYVLESGRMVLSGPSKQMAKDPAIRRAYFGPQADAS
jgi:branched-chain amino acid transport system ATP-binding protein